ncbi:Uncharacterised protein [Corynebacterium kutscheri]|uniref:Uncharacterized protein n=1 Tax=Corynebacterium kutscheri TaxID=35755 RepID=A0A0F6TCW6_9CORY|nr:hypothetical protein [Corynebacterium kutscheri]AKE41106.1 hypothetical protein UL82_04610 [Corynebacterium kutscheri]VEH07014.1 Uncharacterised protein [Corynebacterium kutscheri]VEH09424.1 Uncharacterised protein [Corynebacterium kutscheri]VEH79510.1 Uncharacterised protein [Corynebacterium kutscheri]
MRKVVKGVGGFLFTLFGYMLFVHYVTREAGLWWVGIVVTIILYLPTWIEYIFEYAFMARKDKEESKE